MTATEKLQQMLGELGVGHRKGVDFTIWDREEGDYRARADERTNGYLYLRWYCTPEEAVEATLGERTCHKLPSSGDTVCIVRRHGYEMEFGYWRCSECGCECFDGARYCMNCGAKVVS